MIKIIKEGKRRTVECSECGAVLSYNLEDIQKENINNMIPNIIAYSFGAKGAAPGIREYIKCPCCNTNIIINEVLR